MFLHVGCNFVSNQVSWNFLLKLCTQHTPLAVRTLTHNTAKRTPKRTRTHHGQRPAHIHLHVPEDLRPVFRTLIHLHPHALTYVHSYVRQSHTHILRSVSIAGECWRIMGVKNLVLVRTLVTRLHC